MDKYQAGLFSALFFLVRRHIDLCPNYFYAIGEFVDYCLWLLFFWPSVFIAPGDFSFRLEVWILGANYVRLCNRSLRFFAAHSSLAWNFLNWIGSIKYLYGLP